MNKLLPVFLSLIALFLAYLAYNHINENQPDESNINSNLSHKAKQDSINIKSLDSIVYANKPKLENIKEDCTTIEEYFLSEELPSLNDITQKLGSVPLIAIDINGNLKRQEHPYARFDNESLLNMANAQDPQAMLALGHNLIWQSMNTSEVSSELLAEPSTSEVKTEIDTAMLESGREWLFKAAVHGLPFALKGITRSHTAEFNWIKDNSRFTEEYLKQFDQNKNLYLLLEEFAIKKFISNTKTELSADGLLNDEFLTKYEQIKSKFQQAQDLVGLNFESFAIEVKDKSRVFNKLCKAT